VSTGSSTLSRDLDLQLPSSSASFPLSAILVGAVDDDAVSADRFGDAMEAGTEADVLVAVVLACEGEEGSVWLGRALLFLGVWADEDRFRPGTELA